MNNLQYRDHAVDIHSHIIPGVDDGARTANEAADLITLDREEGMSVIFATPHYGIENGYAPEKSLVQSRFNELLMKKNIWQSPDPSSSLHIGTEWYCSDEIVQRILRKEAFPMGMSDWYMVEFLEWGDLTEPSDIFLYRLSKMKQAGINTILAHPERYKAIRQDWNLAKRIADLGVLLQINVYDLVLNKAESVRNLTQWMVREKLVSFIGSDMHGTREGSRKPRMKEGICWLYENNDREYADSVVRKNAEKYLGVEKLM
ncbi:MAG: hypothetical protein IKE25_09260 [Clostridia bacterium]|nr:hypothetical protein [Clostridia bacterium]